MRDQNGLLSDTIFLKEELTFNLPIPKDPRIFPSIKFCMKEHVL